jgi:hypothetical protein
MAQHERTTWNNFVVRATDGSVVTQNYVQPSSLDKDTGEAQYIKENKLEEIQEEAKKNTDEVQVTKVQSFVITEADSLDELAKLFPKRALEFANYGARLAQQNEQRDFMRDPDSAAVEGDIDLAALVQDAKVRRSADPVTKLTNSMAKIAKEMGKSLDADQIRALILATLQGAQPAPQVTGAQAQVGASTEQPEPANA